MRNPRCDICGEKAQYRCRRSGTLLCLKHAFLDVTASRRHGEVKVRIEPAGPQDLGSVVALACHFWDETEVYCFGKMYDVARLPAYVARVDAEMVGAISYAVEPTRIVIVLLNVLPNYQGAGLGRRLIDAVAAVAARQGLTRLVVATSNDDLLALYLYQRNGFVITDVRAGEILRHHGQEETGFAGMPVRDEIRLERHL